MRLVNGLPRGCGSSPGTIPIPLGRRVGRCARWAWSVIPRLRNGDGPPPSGGNPCARIASILPRPVLIAAGAALCGIASCGKPPAAPITEVIVVSAQDVPSDPADPAWRSAPEYSAALVLQDLVEPRQLTVTTTAVRVRAIGNGTSTAFRLEWTDATRDDLPAASHFTDACAVQIPRTADVNLPAPQMGEKGRTVEIAYWSAFRQTQAEGRVQSIQDLYPNASIDHYPFDAKPLERSPADRQAMAMRYAPAGAAGNPGAAHLASGVQDLIAEGPGTLTPAPAMTSQGKGVRTADGWAVVIVRNAPIAIAAGRTNIALAVWDGSHEEVGARKMRTGWIPALFQGQMP